MTTKKRISRLLTALVLTCSLLWSSLNILLPTPVYAVPTVDGNSTEDFVPTEGDNPPPEVLDQDNPDDSESQDNQDEEEENKDDQNKDEEEEEETTNVCQDETMSVSWFVCSAGRAISKGLDAIYSAISSLLIVRPISTDSSSAIFQVWKYIRDVANTFFAIIMLLVICSQLTGFGISNYGIKRILPRLVIAAIAVNLSFFICSLAVDVSNIAGAGLRNTFIGIKEGIESNLPAESKAEAADMKDASFSSFFGMLTGGAAVAGIIINATTGAGALFWILLITMLAAVITVIIGLVTIAARQGLVAVLVMISPLAFIAYLLPNTEPWFKKWSSLFSRMLVFYPMFSILFGASELIGWTLMISKLGAIWVVMGMAIQVLPLALSMQLMKMSGTILGSLNSALTRASIPLQSGIRNWGTSHADQNRERHLAHSNSTGAHMRRFLDYRKELRNLDTKNSAQTRANIAASRAYKTLASSTGRDINGNDTWAKKPNKYTRNAKLDSLYGLRAETAKTAFSNTISAYNFAGSAARKLSAATGEAFIDYSTQQFRAKNEAQSDQTWLLDQYLAASTKRDEKPERYNRLIRNGAGSLRHLGESSIMGQVISENVAIEERRRREGRVIANKFGVDKLQFRAMNFDKASINDNGIELNADGKPIEDDQFKYLPGRAEEHREWGLYIAQHKDTSEEITKEEYLALSPAKRKNYNRIRYMNINNDNGKPVQQVYFDDAGYMKELIGDDIAIGDPINDRYSISVGVGRKDFNEQTGSLRKYYTTVVGALDSSGYKKKSAEYTAQLFSQLRNGYVVNMGQFNIARLQSIKNPTKPGDFLLNEPGSIENWAGIIRSVYDEDLFKKYFPDEEIIGYRNVNGEALKGYEWGYNEQEGYYDWIKVDTKDPTLEQQKNYIKHILIPEVAQKMFGMINREASPTIRDNQKPATAKALKALAQAIFDAQDNNQDDSININQRLNPRVNLYEGGNPDDLKATINEELRSRGRDKNGQPFSSNSNNSNNNSDGHWNGDGFSPRSGGGGGGNSGGGGGNSGGGGGGSTPIPPRGGGDGGNSSNYNSRNQEQNSKQRLSDVDARDIEDEVSRIFSTLGADYNSIANELESYFRSGIFDYETINYVTQAIYENAPRYEERTPEEMVNNQRFEEKYIRSLHYAIDGIVNHFIAKNRS